MMIIQVTFKTAHQDVEVQEIVEFMAAVEGAEDLFGTITRVLLLEDDGETIIVEEDLTE